jgi:hypothetical protein
VLFATAALGAAVVVFGALSLPPVRLQLVPASGSRTLTGVLHIHTNRSDGRSTPDEVAAIARDAGLDFVILTDHGDGTRDPDPPTYRSGVLCLDGVEISTNGGHYLALDMPRAPYPLGGEARDVVEDVRRLGGFGAAAHPDSPKDELRWDDWTLAVDGIEVLNPDTGWRQYFSQRGWRPRARLFEALLSYPLRPAETVASLLAESNVMNDRWEELARRRPLVALGGVDAHARLELTEVQPGENRFTLPFPGYRALFDTLRIHVAAGPLSGDAAADGRQLLDGIRAGRLYVAVSGLASPPFFEFTASSEDGTVVEQGGSIDAGIEPLTLKVRTNAPSTYMTWLWKGTRLLEARPSAPELTLSVPAEPAVYRVEIRAGHDEDAVWIVSNPIYVRGAADPGVVRDPPSDRPPVMSTQLLFDPRDHGLWLAEHDPGSEAVLEIVDGDDRPELALRYTLADGAAAKQFAALSVSTPGGLSSFDRLSFTARADRPTRLSIQLRAEVEPRNVQRWQRSVYVDPVPRNITLFLDDFRAVGPAAAGTAPVARVRSVVFAIDVTNTAAGAAGQVWIGSPVMSGP